MGRGFRGGVKRCAAAFRILGLLALVASPALGQSGGATTVKPLDPPRGETGKAYLTVVEGRGIKAEIVYLPPDAPLDASVPDPEPEVSSAGDVSPAMRGTAWLVLGLIVFALAFLAFRYRKQFADLFGPRDRRLVRPAGEAAEAPLEAAIDKDLIARLREEADPRIGLRAVLARFLALAAEDNAIPLKRSLTTRELVRRLPGSWAHRADLEKLAREVELVVFGGREISRDAYQRCLDMAAPFLRRTAA